ncbi:hypothetical protein DFH07DRAFT_742190 [Mycena maculata]|uniref:BTB domain-containing protein n=1 Tax=Mycena maculata TaxID=230809 RepID=A0AAD7J9C9_9AGAR|nr:hypothetical protein DFH07DRAFT_742190 [Mycena maculata]
MLTRFRLSPLHGSPRGSNVTLTITTPLLFLNHHVARARDRAPIQDAPPPFSSEPDPEEKFPAPDLILRSGDGVDFHVQTTILSYSSPFFNHMLSSAGSPEIQRDGKTVLPLPEPSAVLQRLLCIAYPVRSLEDYSFAVHNLDGVHLVHQAANKYLFTAVQELLETTLESPALLDAHPHRIARLRDLPALAQKAALVTLKSPICPPDLLFPELELLPASTFQQLHEFHHTCGKAAERIVRAYLGPVDYTHGETSIAHAHPDDGNYEFIWWKQGNPGFRSEGCGPIVNMGYQGDWFDQTQAHWFKNHIETLAIKLRLCPTRRILETETATLSKVDRTMIDSCHACLEHAEHELRFFWARLGERIEASNTSLVECLRTLGIVYS